MSTLIIGCGHLDRGDDAAGLLVARRLREMGVDAEEHAGDAVQLMERWDGAGSVVLIDAVESGGPPGCVSVWDAHEEPLRADASSGSSHGFGVAEAIELARTLDRLPLELKIYCISGARFAIGSEPSAEVLRAVDQAALAILIAALAEHSAADARNQASPHPRPPE